MAQRGNRCLLRGKDNGVRERKSLDRIWDFTLAAADVRLTEQWYARAGQERADDDLGARAFRDLCARRTHWPGNAVGRSIDG